MKQSSTILILLILLSWQPSLALGPQKINVRILTWWDYISKPALKKLGEHGFDVQISIYKSNDVAVSRLISKSRNYDVAILSNQTIKPLLEAGFLRNGALSSISKPRVYYPFLLKGDENSCVPYMWSSTVFAFDGKDHRVPIDKFGTLVALKESGSQIAILDDKLEVLYRMLIDQNETCKFKFNPNNLFSIFNSCSKTSLNSISSKLGPKDFRSSIYEVLLQQNTAAYGWHGEAMLALKKNANVKLAVADRHPVIGYDAVCLVKNKKSHLTKAQLNRFVKLLTDKATTELHVKEFQYFSPYMNQTSRLMPQVKGLHDSLLNKFKVSKPVFISSPDKGTHQKINEWWKGVRYEKK